MPIPPVHVSASDRGRLLGLALALTVACGGDDRAAGTTGVDASGTASAGDGSGPGDSDGPGDDGEGTTGGTDSDPDSTSDDDTGDTGSDTGGSAADWYPGVPYPTDDLPGGIMPTLPVPGAQPGWPYDPIELSLPEPSDAANEYVVTVDGDDATAGNGGNGTSAAPRRTIPLGTFPSGTKIFVYGAKSPYGTVDYDVGEDQTLQCAGAADDPCFLVGFDTPRIGRRIEIEGSSHLVIDGLSFVDAPGGGRPWGSLNVTNSSYITVRNVELRGDGSNSSGGSAMSISDVEFLFSYRLRIHAIGSWETNATGLDVHGWRPAYGNRYLWLIDSELFHLQADGVQTGNSSNPNPQDLTSHYIYIAGNEFYENYENAVDNKNSYHVVLSSNDVHDFYAAEGMAANGTAIILSNNAEGPWTGYHWAINNRVWNTALAIRDSGSETGERNFAIGNAIWNATTAILQANNALDREFWVIHNTAFGAETAFEVFQPGQNASTFVRGNIFHGGALDTVGEVNSVLENNILFGTSVGGNWDVDNGNLSVDPELTAPGSGDMLPGPLSPAIDAIDPEDEVFALFEGLYGLDIREDRSGTPRPTGRAWDIGAIEAR